MDQTQSRITSWTQPPRPEWVQRINDEGRFLDISGIVPLDENSLIKTAIANTGLNDFGSDDWREPFNVLVKGLESEAQLTLMGRILTRSDLLMFLEARLRVEDMYKRHPEIEDEEIVRPIWQIGQGRSGTSYLQILLTQPQTNITTLVADGLFPAPLPNMTPEQQMELANKRITMWNRVTPEVVAIHEFAANVQTETIHLEAMSFRAPAWLNLLGLAPSYNAYIAEQKDNYVTGLNYTKRVCKLKQWLNPGKQWILNSNEAILYMPDVLKVFPDAMFVWSHRDPVKAMSSMINMIGTMMWIRSDQKISTAYEWVTNPVSAAPMLSKPIDWLESGIIPKNQLCNVYYQNLVDNPIDTVAKIYQQRGLVFDDAVRQSISSYTAEHPRTKRPTHQYTISSSGKLKAEREAFKNYQRYFNVPNEI